MQFFVKLPKAYFSQTKKYLGYHILSILMRTYIVDVPLCLQFDHPPIIDSNILPAFWVSDIIVR